MVKEKKTIWKIVGLSVSFLIVVALVIAGWYFYAPRLESGSYGSSEPVALDAELVFIFSKPVNRSELIPSVTPSLSGDWIYEEPLISRHLYRAVRFIPDRPFQPETNYTIEFKGVTDILALGRKVTESRAFITERLAMVSSVQPADGTIGISPQTRIAVKLDRPTGEFAKFSFQIQPKNDIEAVLSAERDEFTFTPDKPFVQGTQYTLTISRSFVVRDRQTQKIVSRSDPEQMYTGQFTIAPPPKLDTVAPTGNNIAVSEPIQLTFSEPMRESTLADRLLITPEVKGTISLSEDGTILTLTPAGALTNDTTYSVTLKSGAETKRGGFLTEDAEFSFTTIGPVRVASIQPVDGVGGIGVNSQVRVAFDQEVDRSSAEQAVSFVPSIDQVNSWDGNTLIISPKTALAYSTIYHLTIAKGIASIHGLPSAADFTSTFMTVDETTKLSIEMDFQDRPLSCEAAALKMALTGKEVSVSETDIMAQIPVQSGARQGGIWGDPYIAFVGDINGKQNTTGYGVYWDPVAGAGKIWRSSEAFTGWTVRQVMAEVVAGNPVVIWGVYGNGYEDDWTTVDGKHIDAWKGEHARTLIGFVGTVENPTKVILNDPYAGQVTWTRDRFAGDWARFGNSGVVVR